MNRHSTSRLDILRRASTDPSGQSNLIGRTQYLPQGVLPQSPSSTNCNFQRLAKSASQYFGANRHGENLNRNSFATRGCRFPPPASWRRTSRFSKCEASSRIRRQGAPRQLAEPLRSLSALRVKVDWAVGARIAAARDNS